MIYDSENWKNELSRELNNIKSFFQNTDLNINIECIDSTNWVEEKDILEISFFKLQKFTFYTSFIIRKLIEANKISDELEGKNYSINEYQIKLDKEVNYYCSLPEKSDSLKVSFFKLNLN